MSDDAVAVFLTANEINYLTKMLRDEANSKMKRSRQLARADATSSLDLQASAMRDHELRKKLIGAKVALTDEGTLDMRPIHELSKYDGGRFSTTHMSYSQHDVDNPVALAEQLIPLLQSQDPEDRRDADRIIFLLGRALTCPDGVWVCQTEYLPDASGRRFSDTIVTWSAHLTKEQAEAWHAYWTARWSASRSDYGMISVHQEDNVPLHMLRHPDAIPG